MNPEQYIALLLIIADQRIVIEQLSAQLAEYRAASEPPSAVPDQET